MKLSSVQSVLHFWQMSCIWFIMSTSAFYLLWSNSHGIYVFWLFLQMGSRCWPTSRYLKSSRTGNQVWMRTIHIPHTLNRKQRDCGAARMDSSYKEWTGSLWLSMWRQRVMRKRNMTFHTFWKVQIRVATLKKTHGLVRFADQSHGSDQQKKKKKDKTNKHKSGLFVY